MTPPRRLSRMRGADLIREARLRAGLTQAELSARTGTQRSVIARWEQGAVSPSFDNMLEVIEACGFELPLMLVPRDTAARRRLRQEPACSRPSGARSASGEARQGGVGVAERPPEVRPVRAAAGARPAPRHLHRDRRLRPGDPGDRGDHATGSTSSPPRARRTCAASTPRCDELNASRADGRELDARRETTRRPARARAHDRARRAEDRPRAGRHARLRRPAPRREPRAARARRPALGRLDR